MQAALQLVRKELGANAVILHTRHITHRRVLPWCKARQEVEITAGLRVADRPSAKPLRKNQLTASRAAAQAGTKSDQRSASTTSLPAGRRPAQPGAVSSGVGRRSDRRPGLTPLPSPGKANQAAAPVASRLQSAAATGQTAAPARPAKQQLRESGPTAPPILPANRQPGESGSTAVLDQRLDSIQKMLEHLRRSSYVGGSHEIPAELFCLFTELVDAGVDEDLARDLIAQLGQNGTPAQLKDGRAAKALLAAMIQSEIRCSEPIKPIRGKRRVVALVGPTGVGKTTTLAKLAAGFRLRDGVKMGLVTADTYRIAAVEQLRTFAEIIELPMKVVTSPREMRRALDELSGLDLVLIDTAGRNPHDELKMRDLKSLLAEADADEVHLVLSLTASLRSLQAAGKKFAVAGTTSMILTKFDEAAGMGTLLSVARRVRLPISYMTTGQDVPNDIEPANAGRIARTILGPDEPAA